jgi:uncharacterized OB-fold protein
MLADVTPFTLALVDLDDGYRMATNIVGCGPAALCCGMRVEVS